jgi:hypothetical protein
MAEREGKIVTVAGGKLEGGGGKEEEEEARDRGSVRAL